MRRGIALFLCLGVWVVAIFLIYDSSDRMMGEGQVGREMLTGVLTFPFSILVLVGALSLTVRLIRRWAVMREEFLPRPSDEEGNHPNEETEGFR